MKNFIGKGLILFTLFSCTDAEKGPEDDEFFDGKSDSYYRPSDMGPIQFGDTITSEIVDDSRYQAWTFTLSGESDVVLETKRANKTVDTVVYLYKKKSSGWGRYIAKNDDKWKTTGLSKLKKTLASGEYRLIVKFYKREQRGKYKLSAKCEGDGCSVEASCNPTSLPSSPGLTAECSDRMLSAWLGKYQGGYKSGDFTGDEICTGIEIVDKGLGYFLEHDKEIDNDPRYWQYRESATGSVVSIEGHADMHISYFFDKNDALLLWSEEYDEPTNFGYTCGKSGETTISEPFNEFCGSAVNDSAGALENISQFDESTSGGLWDVQSDLSDAAYGFSIAADRFGDEHGLSGSDDVEASWTIGENIYDSGEIGVVRMEMNGQSTTYLIAGETLLWQLTNDDISSAEFICQ